MELGRAYRYSDEILGRIHHIDDVLGPGIVEKVLEGCVLEDVRQCGVDPLPKVHGGAGVRTGTVDHSALDARGR